MPEQYLPSSGQTHDSPSDNTTIGDVIGNYEDAGFSAQFWVVEPKPEDNSSLICCYTCQSEFDASKVEAVAMRRFEGASDPSDEAMIVAMICPACGAKGTMLVPYGPNATEAESDVLMALGDSRTSNTQLPSSIAPNE